MKDAGNSFIEEIKLKKIDILAINQNYSNVIYTSY
tara:strand:- start:3921 stop:4025 length:105 start_codon:yes stop_codon:yes gene_type:complete